MGLFTCLILTFVFQASGEVGFGSKEGELTRLQDQKGEFCANEGDDCKCTGIVYYGSNGVYNQIEACGVIECDSQSFGGDPVKGRAKKCRCQESSDEKLCTSSPVEIDDSIEDADLTKLIESMSSADLAEKISALETAIESTSRALLKRYGITFEQWQESFSEAAGLTIKVPGDGLESKLLRAFSKPADVAYIIGVVGMSAVAGHGGLFKHSWPHQMGSGLKPIFAAAGVKLIVRNQAMGGMDSAIISPCIGCVVGKDVDAVVHDYGMVEPGPGNPTNNEIFLRQVAGLSKRPPIVWHHKHLGLFSEFKKLPANFNFISTYYVPPTYPCCKIEDKGCKECTPNDHWSQRDGKRVKCPGQVGWHYKYKKARFIADQMIAFWMVYLKKAINLYRANKDSIPADMGSSSSLILPKPTCKTIFCTQSFDCASAYTPRIGKGIQDLITNQTVGGEPAGAWRKTYPEQNVVKQGRDGKCGYQDVKWKYEGDSKTGWLHLKVPLMEKGTIIVCGEKLDDAQLQISINAKDVDRKVIQNVAKGQTLGYKSSCILYARNDIGLTKNEENFLAMRVNPKIKSHALQVSISQVLWS